MRCAVCWYWLVLLLAVPRVQAQDAGVFPVHATNLSERDSASIGALFSSAYAEQAHRSVLMPAELAPVLQRTGSETRAAELLQLHEYVHVEAVQLPSRIVLSAQLRDMYGRSLYEVRDTAFSLDDLELVSLRMAAALVQRAPVLAASTFEGQDGAWASTTRPRAEKLFGARFALVMPFARDLETQASLLSQFDVRIERRRFFVELAAGFWLPSRTNARQGLGGLVGQLGGSYYLAHSGVSPYVGLGVSPRWFAGEYSGAGLAVNAHVGAMFMCEASTRLYAELRVDQNLMRLHPRTRDDSGDERAYRHRELLPTELSAAVGLGF
jgi:hypothetical protein